VVSSGPGSVFLITDVAKETMRRRARRIQDLLQTVGPLAGMLANAAGSIYTGMKGILGS
jgi:hypothetical protein